MTHVVRPAVTTPPGRVTTVVQICDAAHLHPSGFHAEYVHGPNRDAGLWARWVAVHAVHGFREDRA